MGAGQEAAAVGGLLALAAFFVVERRSANPMLPLEIFSSRQFSAANGVTFWMTQIERGDSYLTSILPPVIVFGLGLTLVVAARRSPQPRWQQPLRAEWLSIRGWP